MKAPQNNNNCFKTRMTNKPGPKEDMRRYFPLFFCRGVGSMGMKHCIRCQTLSICWLPDFYFKNYYKKKMALWKRY